MRSIQIISLLTMLCFNAFGQESIAPDKIATPVQPKVQSATPVNGPANEQVKPITQTSAKPQKPLHPYPQISKAQAAAQFELRMKCDSTFGAEIKMRTGDLQKKMMDLLRTERTTENTKRQNNSNLRKMQDNFKQFHVKDSIAYRDTSVNKMQLRKDAQNERIAAMNKMRTEEGKIYNDPELIKIRQSIADLRKQIEDTIVVIVKDDSKCLSCYKSR
jgi:hypothetical protein